MYLILAIRMSFSEVVLWTRGRWSLPLCGWRVWSEGGTWIRRPSLCSWRRTGWLSWSCQPSYPQPCEGTVADPGIRDLLFSAVIVQIHLAKVVNASLSTDIRRYRKPHKYLGHLHLCSYMHMALKLILEFHFIPNHLDSVNTFWLSSLGHSVLLFVPVLSLFLFVSFKSFSGLASKDLREDHGKAHLKQWEWLSLVTRWGW